MKSSSSSSTNIIPNSPKLTNQPHEENDSTEPPRRSKRQRVEKSFGDDFTVYLMDDTPKTLSEAYASIDVECWKEAVHNEMESLMSNETWEICDCPIACKPVGCKWIFKKKSQI
jgi:hypothetical protein